MEQCWGLVAGDDVAQTIFTYCEEWHRPTDADDTINAKRLHDNVCALVATALAAAAFTRRLETGSLAEVIRWWREAAQRVGDSAAEQEPALPGDWKGTLDGLAHELTEQHKWDLTATRYWTAWWRRKPGPEGRAHEVAIAAVYGPAKSEVGFLGSLRLEVLSGTRSRLIEQPESAVVPFSEKWLETLKIAAGDYGRPLCWCFRCPDNVPWEQRAFWGDSHGGAAAWGFWHVARGKIPDERVIVLASVRPGPGWPGNEAGLALGEVGGVSAKVKAIQADGRFDTIVVAGPSKKEEADTALGSGSDIKVELL